MIKSPLRYPGGKSRAVKLISSLIPDFEEYREPFLGGGSLFVYLKQIFPNKSFWVNDLCNELYLFWHFVQKDLGGLIKQIVQWKKDFLQGKNLYDFLNANMQNFSDLEKAAAFFIYNRITFSGTTLSGGFSNGAFEGRFTQSSIERLKLLKRIVKNVQITNDDYEQLLKQGGQDVFIFLDPPYFSAAKSALYGKNGKLHKTFDHERFARAMRECNHKWLITYDDSEYIKSLFSFANIFTWNITYGMRNVLDTSNQNGKELFISNYLEYCPRQEDLDFIGFANRNISVYNQNIANHRLVCK
ncbi:MAG: DNA adenine methylase [Elusimicrobiota bacterium]|jgi:DNA adenine methylase|nr:DNA adenine methylase [Elusimicrobiota bacterium]